MKVVHVELGRHLYGGARQVAYLLEGLAAWPGGHALVCSEDAAIAQAVRNPAVSVWPMAFRGDLDAGFVRRLRRLLVAEGADLLHVHSRKGDLPAILAGRLAGLPVVLSRRVDNPPNWADRRLKFPRCARIITISAGILEVLRNAGVAAERLACVPSAIDTSVFGGVRDRLWLERELGVPRDAPLVGIAAQLIPRKGHEVLFAALAELAPRHPMLRALVLGRGPLEAELEARVQSAGLGDVVRFAGFRTDLPRLLPCLDVLAHPAWREGLGIALLEAAACGVPIVASRAGGMPEAVEDGVTGYLIAPGDSRALADRLDRLLTDRALAQRLGAAGRRRVEQRFAVPGMVEGNYRVYEAVLRPPAAGSAPAPR
jgi:glycosyltransferase involved in cell wall biosynthesis